MKAKKFPAGKAYLISDIFFQQEIFSLSHLFYLAPLFIHHPLSLVDTTRKHCFTGFTF